MDHSKLTFKKKLEFKYILQRIIFSIAAAILISKLKLDFIESYFFDLRMHAQAYISEFSFFNNTNETHSVIVLINGKTIEKYQADPTYQEHLKLLNYISSQNPKAILYEFRTNDDDFVDIKGSDSEKAEFAQLSKSIPELYFSTQNLKMRGVLEELKLKPPLDSLKLISLPITADNKLYGKDGVTRRITLKYQDQTMGYLSLASKFNPDILNLKSIKGQFELLDTLQTYIHYIPKYKFPVVAFEDVIQEKISKNLFENKIVIVGTDLGRSSKEYVMTPFSREITAMTNAELQAQQIETLIKNASPQKGSEWVDILITFLVTLFTVYVTLSLKPFQGLIILITLLLTVTALNSSIFIFLNHWYNLSFPFLAIFLSYYFFIPYRLIQENRRSWEFFQKHKLLSQVEELKTNFISMMSHDLKTPIARIQGMAEVISKDSQPLSDHQLEALSSIKSSSEDLLKFINAILQYGRIESEGIQLHKQNKDVNSLIENVIQKYDFMSKVKKIKIKTELEPLFPILIDPELIKQIFSNLLENAIKYSPDESTVLIRTKEEQNNVIIQFQDQGMGIPAEDIPNIFMKFFRTKTVKTSTIKGSGLGLYLAKYFVELHQGQIQVFSQQGQGSTFEVTLPILKV